MKNTTATIARNEIAVSYSERPEVGRDFLTIAVPNGWDDVAKITNKVLDYEGRRFVFVGWNSDRNEAFFAAPHGGSAAVATIHLN